MIVPKELEEMFNIAKELSKELDDLKLFSEKLTEFCGKTLDERIVKDLQ